MSSSEHVAAGDHDGAGGPLLPVTDLAGYFGGCWLLERRISDDAGGALGAFTGTASFTAGGTLLVYAEEGTLQLGAYQGQAHRCLHYRITGPGQASVFFDYGDFFHDLDLRTGTWRAAHPCRDDLYRGEFRVLGPDSWRQEWTVAGPAKNHTMVTDFRRR